VYVVDSDAKRNLRRWKELGQPALFNLSYPDDIVDIICREYLAVPRTSPSTPSNGLTGLSRSVVRTTRRKRRYIEPPESSESDSPVRHDVGSSSFYQGALTPVMPNTPPVIISAPGPTTGGFNLPAEQLSSIPLYYDGVDPTSGDDFETYPPGFEHYASGGFQSVETFLNDTLEGDTVLPNTQSFDLEAEFAELLNTPVLGVAALLNPMTGLSSGMMRSSATPNWE
jgi:hypothetical protein